MIRIANGARIEQIDSYEAERTVPATPVQVHEHAPHEPHIGVEVIAGAIASVRGTAHLRPADHAVEVGDRRHLEADPGRQQMDERIAWHDVEILVEAARDRPRRGHARGLRECRQRVKQAHARQPAQRDTAAAQHLPPRNPPRGLRRVVTSIRLCQTGAPLRVRLLALRMRRTPLTDASAAPLREDHLRPRLLISLSLTLIAAALVLASPAAALTPNPCAALTP